MYTYMYLYYLYLFICILIFTHMNDQGLYPWSFIYVWKLVKYDSICTILNSTVNTIV